MNINIEQLSFRYPGSKEPVFKDFDFSAASGITLLKGFSGCGKSTLLRLIASLLTPDRGVMEIEGCARYGSTAYLRDDVGFVFQQLNLLPLASIGRNVKIAAQLAGKSAATSAHWIDLLGLKDYVTKKPAHLSGGQLQRAALARALAKEPKILLLDEPTSGLDDLNTSLIKEVLEKQINPDTICLIATHDNRLHSIAHEILDFNTFLPVEEHLQTLVGKSNLSVK